jgi:ferritin-like metal-binding protein YciE
VSATALQEQLTKYLTDAHSIEEQALQQLKSAPDLAGDPEIATIFRIHLGETQEHERLVEECLEARGADPSRLKDLIMKVGGSGFLLFARSQPDTPGKLVSHAYSYEHFELAAYELLGRVAERAGDEETAQTATKIGEQEQAMADRLESIFDRAVEASLSTVAPADLPDQVRKHLGDAHAIEAQAVELLERGVKEAGHPELARLYEAHLAETRDQQELLDERLAALGGDVSSLKDSAMRAGALNWALFFQAQPDTPGKLAAFAYAFEHLEIAGYEQLKLVADHAGDEETVDVAARILPQERAAAKNLAGAFDEAVEASLAVQGLTAP